jgi:transposase-like zinc-binding protein/IstB-like ATP binding protein/putative transposase
VPAAQPVYRPRDAEHTVLYGVVREHLHAFLRAAEAGDDGRGLPPFIEREFREFLTCGVLAHGFVRLRCEGCALERLVPFSWKGRGFCPSCGGRRMTERAAHLLDAVLPWVPVRQWVLTMPYRLRYLLAWDHRLSRAVLGVYARALLDLYRRRAQRDGLPDGRTGTVTVIQRFGSGLNLNIHFHTLALDGVFAEAGGGSLDFHLASPPTDEEVARLLTTVYRGVRRLLARRGLDPEAGESAPPDPLAEASASLAGMAGDWGEVFNDQVLATAILDRLLHHATTVNIKGDSYRLREKKKAGLLGRRPKPAGEPGDLEEVGAEA